MAYYAGRVVAPLIHIYGLIVRLLVRLVLSCVQIHGTNSALDSRPHDGHVLCSHIDALYLIFQDVGFINHHCFVFGSSEVLLFEL